MALLGESVGTVTDVVHSDRCVVLRDGEPGREDRATGRCEDGLWKEVNVDVS